MKTMKTMKTMTAHRMRFLQGERQRGTADAWIFILTRRSTPRSPSILFSRLKVEDDEACSPSILFADGRVGGGEEHYDDETVDDDDETVDDETVDDENVEDSQVKQGSPLRFSVNVEDDSIESDDSMIYNLGEKARVLDIVVNRSIVLTLRFARRRRKHGAASFLVIPPVVVKRLPVPEIDVFKNKAPFNLKIPSPPSNNHLPKLKSSSAVEETN